MLGFFVGTLSHMAQRFFSFYLARREWGMLRAVFSANILLNFAAASILLLVAETGGIWFIKSVLQIPEGRQMAALFVYECSIITFFISLMSTPFQAILIAEENMEIYSLVAVMEGIAKLIMAYLLTVAAEDKLIVYSALLCMISVGSNSFYILYSRRKYSYVRFSFCRKKEVYQNIFAFSSWNLLGAFATLMKSQGISILLNLFCGPVINASRGISLQVNGVISSFMQNFMTAIDPQIIKSYSEGNFKRFDFLLIKASKISCFLGLLIILPLSLNIHYVMSLWLGEVPPNTEIFIILVLIDALIIGISDPILTGVQAIGNMRASQCITGGIALCNVPISYMMMYVWGNPVGPFWVNLFLSILIMICQIVVFRHLYSFSVKCYIQKALFPIGKVICIAVVSCCYLFSEAETFMQLIVNCIASTMTLGGVIWFWGMDLYEKKFVKDIIKRKWQYWQIK